MEVTKRFLGFLNELDNTLVRDQYNTSELQDYLEQIRNKLHGTGSSSEQHEANPDDNGSMDNLDTFDQTLVESSCGIYKKLKQSLDYLSLLQLYITNFPLDSLNITKFLTIYCKAIFESTNISLISETFQAPYYMRLLHGEQSRDEKKYREIISEISHFMGDEEIKPLNLEMLPLLSGYFEEHDYLGNIAIRYTKDCKPFYLILHFKEDSPFTGYFIAGKHYQTYPLVLDFIKDVLDITTKKTFNTSKSSILQGLELIEGQIIQLNKNFLLSFVASEIQANHHCDMATSLTIGDDHEEIKQPEKASKFIQIVLLKYNRLEIKANFPWDNIGLNSQLSALWGKLHKLSKLHQERTYFRNQLKTTNNLFLQFSKKGQLIYQSGAVPDVYRTLIETNNFLLAPTTRSMKIVLAKDKQFLKVIQNTLQEFEESNLHTQLITKEFKGLAFDLVCQRDEWTKTTEGFCIVLRAAHSNNEHSDAENIEQYISNLERTGEKRPSKLLQCSVNRMKLFLGHQPQQDHNTVLGANMDLAKLKGTIVSEYLPEELTRPEKEEGAVGKLISAVKKIKIDMTPRTAFRHLGEKHVRNKSAALLQTLSSPTISRKPEKFTKELLIPERKDLDNLTNWSYDISQSDDWMEKGRFAWVILRDMNLISEYKIDLRNFCEFMTQLKEGYNSHNNSYHNFDHGVSVMHATYYLMKHMSTRFSSLVNLGLLISALCHDVDHSGKTNLFEVNSSSRLAIRYHDRSVLEQHHAAYTFQILSKESSNIFSEVKAEDYKELRKLIIANILATDMKEHFDMMKAFRELNTSIKGIEDDNLSFSNDDIKLITGMLMHCADLSGATKDFPLAHKWSIKVNEEFTKQVMEEEALGIPITPYFKDLNKKHVMAKQEIAFISFMVKPLWELFDDFCGGAMKITTNNIENNLKQWNNILESALKDEEKKKEQEAAQEQLHKEEVKEKTGNQ